MASFEVPRKVSPGFRTDFWSGDVFKFVFSRLVTCTFARIATGQKADGEVSGGFSRSGNIDPARVSVDLNSTMWGCAK